MLPESSRRSSASWKLHGTRAVTTTAGSAPLLSMELATAEAPGQGATCGCSCLSQVLLLSDRGSQYTCSQWSNSWMDREEVDPQVMPIDSQMGSHGRSWLCVEPWFHKPQRLTCKSRM